MPKTSPIKIAIDRLSGPIQAHDSRIKIEPMTDSAVLIHYQFVKTLFGKALIASTKKGVCYFGFAVGDKKCALQELLTRFPDAVFKEQSDRLQASLLARLTQKNSHGTISLHLNGTPFQQKVWHALLKIPDGTFATYGSIATFIKHPDAYRAVGTAVGMNPVCILIPCHRVVQASGALGNYHWGTDLKAQIIEWENKSASPGRSLMMTDSMRYLDNSRIHP